MLFLIHPVSNTDARTNSDIFIGFVFISLDNYGHAEIYVENIEPEISARGYA